jgi:hypothetical protein
MIQASVSQQGVLGIEQLCAMTGVSRAGYYRHWQASAPRQEETALRDAIQRLSVADRKLGYRPITVLLKREGWVVNHKRVERLRRTDNLLCLRKPAFRPATTDSRHAFALYPNLAWKLRPTSVNLLWVADITYVRLAEAFVYLAVILDAYSRRVVGWGVGGGGSFALRTGVGGAGDGAGDTPGGARYAGASLRPWRAVCVRRLHRAAGGGGGPAQHEPRRLSVGQCDGGEFHGDAEARGGRWPGLQGSGGCHGIDRPVLGGDLQPAADAFGAGLPGPGGV